MRLITTGIVGTTTTTTTETSGVRTITVTSPVRDDVVVATLEYVIRGPGGAVRAAKIDARGVSSSALRIDGGWEHAVRAAQLLASTPVQDPFHRLPVNQTHAVLQAADGAFWIAPLIGDHRDVVGPIFIDGMFYDRTGLAVWATRPDAGPSAGARLQAIVGTRMMIDLSGRQTAGVEVVDDVLARRPARS